MASGWEPLGSKSETRLNCGGSFEDWLEDIIFSPGRRLHILGGFSASAERFPAFDWSRTIPSWPKRINDVVDRGLVDIGHHETPCPSSPSRRPGRISSRRGFDQPYSGGMKAKVDKVSLFLTLGINFKSVVM